MKKIVGSLLIAVSAASFGTLGIFGKLASDDGAHLFTTLFIRFGVSALIMWGALLLRREGLPRGKTLVQLIGMGAVGYVGQSFAYLTAVNYASPGLVTLLLYLYPLFVAVLSMLFLGEKPTRPKMVALALALVGAALTVEPRGGRLIGALFAVAAALIYSVYIVVGAGVMKRVSAVQSSAIIFTSAAAVYGALTFFKGAQFPHSAVGWLAIAGMIIFATVVAVGTFLAGLGMVGAVNAAMLSTLEPIVAALLAAWIFNERLGAAALLGGALILTAVLMTARAEMKPEAAEGLV